MAKETHVELWIGTDFEFPFHILNEAETAAIDITAWTLSWIVKRRLTDADADALLTKTTTSGIAIAGTYASDPDTNAQRATVSVADTDTDAIAAGTAVYELKRTGAGVETILAYGRIPLRRGAHRT